MAKHQYPADCSKRGTDRKLRASTTQSTHQFVCLSHPLRFLSAAKNKVPFLDSRSMHKILVPEARETTDLRAETGTSVTLHACHGLTWSCLMFECLMMMTDERRPNSTRYLSLFIRSTATKKRPRRQGDAMVDATSHQCTIPYCPASNLASTKLN